MKKLVFVFALLFYALPALAQLTTVSGTVKGIDGIPYSGAQLKMQLVTTAGSPVSGQPTVTVNNQAQCVSGGFGSAPCQVPFQGTVGPFQISPTGTFTINLQDNTLVTPAATQWLFTANSLGSPPPLGTGPQVCTAQLTISGATQTINLSACPALGSGGSNGQIPTATVATLPAAAAASGQTYWVTDGNGAGNCTVGGGPSLVLCRSNGSTWIPEAQNTGLTTLTAIRLSTQCGAADVFCYPVFQDGNVSIGSTWAANTSNGTTATALTTNVNDMGAQYLQFNTAQTNIGGIFTTTGTYYSSILAAFKISGTLGAPASCSGTNEIAASATTITVSITPTNSGSGSILIAFAAVFQPDGVTVTFSDNNGNTWNNVLPQSVMTAGLTTSQMGYVQNNNSGATTVTATFGASATFRSIFVCNFSGMASSAVLDAAAGGFRNVGGGATIMAGTVTTSGNDLLFQAARSGISTFTVGTLGVAANTITTNATYDPPFSNANLGQKAVLSTACDTSNGFIGLCTGAMTNPFAKVVSVADPHHIVVSSLMAVANTAPDAHGFTGWLVTAHDDSSQYATAFNKAVTIVGAALYLPCGLTIIGQQPFNETTVPVWNPDIIGCGGESSTIMVPSLDYNYFGAVGGLVVNIPSNNVRFVSPTVQTPNIYGKLERFTIWGLGLPTGGGSLPIVNMSNGEIDSVDCTGFAAGSTSTNNFINASAGGSSIATHLNNIHVWICGAIGVSYQGGANPGTITGSYLQPGGQALVVSAGFLQSSGNVYYGNGAACSGASNNSIQITGGNFASYADSYRGLTTSGGNTKVDGMTDAGIGLCQGITVAGGNVAASKSLIPNFTMSSGSFSDLGSNYATTLTNPWTNGTLSVTGGTLINSGSITGQPVVAGKLVLSAGWGTTASWTTGPVGFTKRVQGTITASGTGQAANPTITYTFPTPFGQATNIVCKGSQIGGTQAAVANPFTVGAPTATSVVFTYTGTPTAGNTLQVVLECDMP